MAVCRICKKDAQKDNVRLERVNPLGEKGIFECYPSCDIVQSFEESLLGALDMRECD